LRISLSQEGSDDEIPLANGPTTRAMARRIQKDGPLSMQGPS